jgi:hypothetical protein
MSSAGPLSCFPVISRASLAPEESVTIGPGDPARIDGPRTADQAGLYIFRLYGQRSLAIRAAPVGLMVAELYVAGGGSR